MNKIKFLITISFLILFPLFSEAQTLEINPDGIPSEQAVTSKPITFKAKVIEVIDEKIIRRENGTELQQQNLKLLSLDGEWRGREIFYNGISEVEVANSHIYKVGDKVYVDGYDDESGGEVFYVVDFVRSGYLYILSIIFFLIVLVIGQVKGFKALLGLGISFVVIVKLILPQILQGRSPFLVSLLGGVIILAIIIYLTEGFKRKSHIAVLSVLISLFVTLILSIMFTNLCRLTGMSQEESAFLIGAADIAIDFKGLLLAGFIIGAIGVLDDIIVGQIEAVERIKEANSNLPAAKVFALAYKIGNTHLGAIINTLFLTYAGAALPLLLLFILSSNSGLNLERLINTELISTEIVRTLVGSIGVILSMPIATVLAAIYSKTD